MQTTDARYELLEAMADGIVICDERGTILFANRQMEHLSGYTRAELLGRGVDLLVPERHRQRHAVHRDGYVGNHPSGRAMGSGLDIRLRRKDGTEFAVDIALSPIETDGSRQIVAALRDVTERQRANARLAAMLEINEAMLRGDDVSGVLRLIARRARELAYADAATICVPEPGDALRIAVADGEGMEALVGQEMPWSRSLAGEVLTARRPLIVEDAASDPRADAEIVRAAEMGPAIVVPLVVDNRPYGTLTVANGRGRRAFDDEDLRLVQLFAGQAAVALDYGRIRLDLERLAVAEDRERIGREIHDGSIQALFAVGMNLQAAAATAPDDGVRRRLENAVDQIDGVIRDLRNYIFGLRPGLLADRALDQALRQLAADNEDKTQVTTVVDVDPQVASRLAAKAGDVVQLAREALSNVARHAQATTCRVSLSDIDGMAVLEIEDDGTGFDASATGGSGQGLRNLRDRAQRLGGEMELESVAGEGTTVRFRIFA